MEDIFITKTTQPYFEIIIFIMMFLVLAVIKQTNPKYSGFLVNNVLLKKDSFYKSLSSVNLHNKSTTFLHVNFFLSGAILLSKIYNTSFTSMLLVLFIFKFIQTIGIWGFEKLFLNQNEVISFIKRRISLTELTGVIALIFLFFTHYLNIEPNLFALLISLVMIIIWAKTTTVLNHSLSYFHIILYLCTLEILPLLFLAKFIYKHLA